MGFSFTLHERQADVWQSQARFKWVAAGRRGGKSDFGVWWKLTEAMKSDAARHRHAEHWVVAPTYKILGTLWSKFVRMAPRGVITGSLGTQDNPRVLYVGNSRIVFRSAQRPETLVADALRSLWMDEAGIIQEKVWNESLRAMLVDYRAPALFTFTPKGRNWSWRGWKSGRDKLNLENASFRWHSACNPYVEEDEIAAIAATLPQRVVEQEIWAEFLSGQGDVFRTIGANIAKSIALFGERGRCTHPTRFLGVDLGKMIDFTVLHGMCEWGHTTGWDRFNKISWPVQKARVINAASEHPETIVIVDSAGIGDPITDDLISAGLNVIPVHTGAKKVALVEGHIVAIENREVLMPNIDELRDEHEAFTYEYLRKSGRVSYHAPESHHDDTVIAAALATWGFKRGPQPLELGVATAAA